MAFPQMKKRFSLFSSPPLAPQILSNASSLLTTPQEIREDNKPTSDEIRKSFENLEKLVLTADEYRDCVNKLSKISKNFSKCLKDYGNCKGIDKSYAQFYENHAEVQAKLYKALQKEFEILQRFWDKYSKKVAKYVASLTSISTDVARLRTEYAEEVMRREKHTHSVISQIICRFTEGQFASFNDSLKKCGPSITKVKEWTPFAGQDIPLPLDLDGFLEMQTMTLPETSISEMQKVAMRHKTAPSPTETPSIESNPAPIINDINEYENETITPAPPIVTEVAKSSNSVPNSKKKLSNDSHLTPNLLSSLSIGIHDNDNPFFRDGSNMIIKTGEKDSTKLEENHASSLSITKSNDKILSLKKDQLKNEKNINGSDIDNENEFNEPNDKYYSNEYHVMDIERIANDSPAPSFETERLVRSFPIDLPVRSQPSTPTNSPSEKSSVFYNMKTDHLSGYIRDLDSIINSNTDHQGTHPYHDEIH
ncbi:11725_t:CDS:2, partial [Funneliformis mosseae]